MDIGVAIEQRNTQVISSFSGVLTVFSLSEGKRASQWIKLFPTEGKSWLISGKNLSKVDTAGLAFFIECVSHAKKNKMNLEFSLLSSELENLIRAQGISELIRPSAKFDG